MKMSSYFFYFTVKSKNYACHCFKSTPSNAVLIMLEVIWLNNKWFNNSGPLWLTVCSDRLMRTSSFPVALAMAATRLVFPTPGDPSSRRGRGSCRPRSTLWALTQVVGAWREYLASTWLSNSPVITNNKLSNSTTVYLQYKMFINSLP